MSETISILCVDDEPDVLDVVVRELASLEDTFPLETAGSAAEARECLDRLRRDGTGLGVIVCDHIMPGENGVDLLVAMAGDEQWRITRKVLLTGQAGLEATVRAINRAELAHYIAKPWENRELLHVVRRQLGLYIAARGLDPLPYLRHLEPGQAAALLRHMSDADR
ncbi:MAG: response regulator [Spirochaetaceae bacterium]|nr:MAG: response regulator [Spirochaetaceae bacterium]